MAKSKVIIENLVKKDLGNVVYRYEFEELKERVKNLEVRVASALKKK